MSFLSPFLFRPSSHAPCELPCPPRFSHVPSSPGFFFGSSGPGSCLFDKSFLPSNSFPVSSIYTTVGPCSSDPSSPLSAPPGRPCASGSVTVGTRPLECCHEHFPPTIGPCDRYGWRTVTTCRENASEGRDTVFDAWSNDACKNKVGGGMGTNLAGCQWCGSDGVAEQLGEGQEIVGGRCWVPYYAVLATETQDVEEVRCRALDPVHLGQWTEANTLDFGEKVIYLSSIDRGGVCSHEI